MNLILMPQYSYVNTIHIVTIWFPLNEYNMHTINPRNELKSVAGI